MTNVMTAGISRIVVVI